MYHIAPQCTIHTYMQATHSTACHTVYINVPTRGVGSCLNVVGPQHGVYEQLRSSRTTHYNIFPSLLIAKNDNETANVSNDIVLSIDLPARIFEDVNSDEQQGLFFNLYTTAVLFPLVLPPDVLPENYSYVINSSVVAASVAGKEVTNLTDSEEVTVRLVSPHIQRGQVSLSWQGQNYERLSGRKGVCMSHL